jgi:hypothetical protein
MAKKDNKNQNNPPGRLDDRPGFNEDKWEALKGQALDYERDNGAPVNLENFNFLIGIGAKFTEKDQPYIDNYLIHRIELSVPEDKAVYRFKTLTDKGQKI